MNADQIKITSKGDTTLKGAQATANRIDADVGKNLNIISQQDTLNQNSKQMGVGARVQISAGTAWDASGNFNNASAKGNSKQVNQQSGLFAGDGGYHVKADHVDLKGGAISSTATKDNNDLTANSLSFSNIENESSHKATTVALSGGTRFGDEKGTDSKGVEYTNNVNWRDSTTFSPTLPQQDKGDDSSTTYATLTAGNINIGGKETTVEELGIHSDINTANQKVDEVPDLQAILEKQKIVSDATSTIVAATRTYSQNKQKDAEAQKQAAEQQAIAELEAKGGEDWAKYNSTDNTTEKQQLLKNNSKEYKEASDQAQAWGMGGDSSRALNAVTIAITAALGGQTDLQAATNALAPYAAQIIGQEFGHGEDKNTAAQLISHAILGATLAYINGGDPTAGGSAAVASEAAANYLTNQYKDNKEYQDANGEFQANLLPESVKAQIRDLTAGIGAVIGGAVGDSSYNAQLAGVIGQNAVENNRMLHREEVDLIQNLAKEYAKEKGISLEEAETQLTRGALYHIDEGWQEAFDSKLDASDIEKYNQAYQYLLTQTKDESVDEINSNFNAYQDSRGVFVTRAKDDTYKGHISDSERQKADMYIGEAGKGFTATEEDFKNKDIFLTNTLAGSTNKGSADYNSKKEFIQNSAAIKDSEISFLERLNSSVDRDISGVKGAVTGVATEVKDTIVGVYEFLAHPIDNTKELINSTIEAAKNPVQTAKNVSEGMDQGLEKYNTTIDLYKMQKDEGAEAEYKANIAGQIVGAGGVGAAGKKGAEATVDAVKKAQQVAKEAEIAEALRKKQSVENNTNVDNNVLDDSIARENFWNDKTGGESPSLVRNPDVMNGLMQQNGIKFKDGVTKEDIFNIIYNTPAGKRPDPSVYLSPAYIKDWNDSWSEGAIRFTSKSQVAKHGTIGSNEAFVIPKTVFDSLYKESNGNLAYIERKLSLSDGYLSSNSTGAFWIKQQDRFKVQLPTGNEGGANVQWLPGGKTLNGTREGILDLKNSGLKFEEVSLGK